MDLLPKKGETAIFQQFKKAVSDLNQNDGVLIRFLRARDHDIVNAEKMLRSAMQWREEIDIDSYLKWEFPSNYATDLPYKMFGNDYDGAPSKWTTKKLVENGEGDQELRYIYSVLERGLQRVIECGNRGVVAVMDMEGLSYAQATHIPSLKLTYNAIHIMEQCYPEIAKRVYILNAPWIFSFAFTFVKHVIAKKTLEKVKMFSYKEEWHAEFRKRFPIDSIVPELQQPMPSY